tara:strand:+ start:642 stop:1835 length:1194 start_codon:yes stop_codon:yes gene_type:complete
MFNNNLKDRSNLSKINIRDNYFNNAHTPANFYENTKLKNLFQNNNIQPNQNNNVNFNNESNLGSFLFEQQYQPKQIIDNNVEEIVRNQFIEEKDIIIDTADRDIDIFPNIFDFTLKLGSTDTTPGPSIHRSVKNVKYLKLVKAILPDNYKIKKSELTDPNIISTITSFHAANNFANNDLFDQFDNNYSVPIYIIHYILKSNNDFILDYFVGDTVTLEPDYSIVYSYSDTSNGIEHFEYKKSTNPDYQIEKGRYFQLHIDQLPKNNDLATSSSVSNSFALLFPSKEDNRGFNFLDGMETDKIFKFSDLGNFTNMSIKILDSTGDQLVTNNNLLWNNELSERKSYKNIVNINSTTKDDYTVSFRSPKKYLRHPLSSKFQSQFIFTVGEIQLEINKKTFN